MADRCSPVKETIRELPEVIGAPPPMPEDEKEKETPTGIATTIMN